MLLGDDTKNLHDTLGLVTFQGGHTEELLYYTPHSKDYIVFCTDDGLYRYRNLGRSTFDFIFEQRVDGRWIYADIKSIEFYY